jgi:hypothetical protein
VRLDRAAAHFDNTPCLDGYTSRFCFNGQFQLFDDVKRDSESAERRILSLSPDCQIPARRVIAVEGKRYIVGHGTPDYFKGRAVRISYVVHEATEMLTSRTLAQACLDTGGIISWAAAFLVKNLAFSEQDSVLTRQMHFHTALVEPVSDLVLSPIWGTCLIRQRDRGPAGTAVFTADQQPEPALCPALISGSGYDPLTDTLSSATTSVTVLRLRWQSMFNYMSKLDPTFGPDDEQFVFAQSAVTPQVGQHVTIQGGSWLIKSVQAHSDIWLCRGTRHV